MTQLRILFFQPNYSSYRSAYYQCQFSAALCKVHQVFMYGPGYPSYDPQHAIGDVLKLCPFEPDLICFGAGWERDEHPTIFYLHPNINVANLDIPSVMILNKEYKKLDQKFQFILDNNIRVVFTAHHNFIHWQEKLGVRFVHFPFATDIDLFRDYGQPKQYDFGFSGSLLIEWTDLRSRIKNKIFWREHHRLPRYWFLRVYWGEWGSGDKWKEDYARLINSSWIWLSTPSAIDLVSPRFYEVMAAKSLLFCNRSSVYDGLFVDGQHCVMFEQDLSDFNDKLFYYLKHKDERQSIVEQACHHVRENHTWEKRVEKFTEAVKDIV